MGTPPPSEGETRLLILPQDKTILPLNPEALGRAQATQSELRKGYADALVLDRHFGLRPMTHIEVLGPYGAGLGRKLLSRLTSAWAIEVTLSHPLDTPLDEVQALVCACLARMDGVLDAEDHARPGHIDLRPGVRAADSLAGILDALQLPAPEDALDVL